jgi:capsular polysaccharide biosynthesis protein
MFAELSGNLFDTKNFIFLMAVRSRPLRRRLLLGCGMLLALTGLVLLHKQRHLQMALRLAEAERTIASNAGSALSTSQPLLREASLDRLDPVIYTQLHASIDLASVHQQRLKPWTDMMILGGEICPGPASMRNSVVNSMRFPDPKRTLSSDDNRYAEANAFVSNEDAEMMMSHVTWRPRNMATALVIEPLCPDFMPCMGALPHVRFCKMKYLKELRPLPFVPPHDIEGKIWTSPELVYQPMSLPWEASIVSITGGAYLNRLGQVFTQDIQYLHGGCQDIVDSNHGGPRSYSHLSSNLTVRQFRNVVNLVHLYGGNYYHFLVEMLPRFYLMLPFLKLYPQLNIVVHPKSPLHLLRLIGIQHPEALQIHTIDLEHELIYATDNIIFPLAPRCLHAPKTIWRRIRQEFSENLAERIAGLPTDFALPLTFMDYLRQWTSAQQESGLSLSTPDWNINDLPLIRVVYVSRLNMAPRRHFEDELAFLLLLRNRLHLRRQRNGLPGITITKSQASKPLVGDEHVVTYYSSKGTDQQPAVSLTVLYGNETLATTIQALFGAAIFISPHGAAMSNMIFMPSKAQIWELGPQGYWNPCFMYLANALGMRHGLVRGDSDNNSAFSLTNTQLEGLVHAVAESIELRWQRLLDVSLKMESELGE